MIVDDLRRQAGHRASHTGDLMHDGFATGFGLQGPLDRFDLATNSAYPREQSLLFTNSVHDVI